MQVSLSASLLAPALLTLPAPTQQVFHVASESEWETAYAQAVDGDTILFAPGTYLFFTPPQPTFSVNKAIRIAGDGGVASLRSFVSPHFVQAPPSGGALVLENLSFSPLFGQSSGPGLVVSGGAGSVWMHGCSASGFGFALPGLSVGGAELYASSCSFSGAPSFGLSGGSSSTDGGPGVSANGASLHFDDCTLQGLGGHSAWAGNPSTSDGGPALRATDGSVVATGTTFTAGSGGGSTTLYCPTPGDGGHAFELDGAAPTSLSLWACSVAAGSAGGGAPGCSGVGVPGAPFSGTGYDPAAVFTHPFDVGLDAPGTVAAGSTVSVDFATEDVAFPRFLLVEAAVGPPLLGSLAFDYALGPQPVVLVLPASGPLAAATQPLPPGSGALWASLQGLTVAAGQPVFTPPRWVGLL